MSNIEPCQEYIRMIIYKYVNMCPFDYTVFAVSGTQ